MPQFESESLVLKSYNLAEADRIVVFFTRDHGIVRGVAKGAKRLKSRFGSTLEPFSNVELTYFQKDDRELVSIQHVELNRSLFDSASDPEFLNTLAYVADLLIAFMPPHDPSEKVYRMTKACVEASRDGTPDLASVRLYFELWMLRLGGYLPDWSLCGECGRDLATIENVSLRPDHHLICANCSPPVRLTPIGRGHRRLFHDVQKLSPPEFLRAAGDEREAVLEISSILRRIIAQILGRDLIKPIELAVVS
ncbi:MAG: DNA repair protein RecO [Acidobacteria bacterium]|nr:DNA repair protein RecO [Acidobacteriota bacterium]